MLAENRLGSLVTSQLQLFVATATIATIISGWDNKYSINTIEVMSFFSININKDDVRQSPWNLQTYLPVPTNGSKQKRPLSTWNRIDKMFYVSHLILNYWKTRISILKGF